MRILTFSLIAALFGLLILSAFRNTSDLDHCVACFIEERFPDQLEHAHVERLPRGKYTGLSNCPVFFVKDHHGTVRYVVKAYDKKGGKFGRHAELIKAVNVVSYEDLQFSQPLQLEAEGIVSTGMSKYGLVVLSVAPGKSLAQQLSVAAQLEGGERERALRNLEQGYRAAGVATAELHTIHPVVGDEESSFYRTRERKLPQQLGLAMEKLGQERQWAESALEQVFRRHEGETRGLAHGDLHPSNVFWDGETITFIDLDFLSHAVEIEGLASGPTTMDFVRLRQWTAIEGSLLGLTTAELEPLLDAFDQGYGAIAPLPPITAQSYWRMLFLGTRIAKRALTEQDFSHEGPEVLPYYLELFEQEVAAALMPFPHVEVPLIPLGRAGNPVFRAYDEEGELIAYIKAYKNPELCDRLLQGVEYSDVDLLACGEAGGFAYGALSKAPGKTIWQWLHEEAALPLLRKAALRTAEALAALHQLPTDGQGELAFPFRQREEMLRQQLPAKLASLGLDPQPFLQALDVARTAHDADCGAVTYTHGDPHPGNIVYDPETDTVQLIDLDNVALSIGESGLAHGSAAYDVERFAVWFYGIGHRCGYKDEDLVPIVDEFRSLYTSQNPLSEAACRYWRLLFWGTGVLRHEQNLPFLCATLEENIHSILDSEDASDYAFCNFRMAE